MAEDKRFELLRDIAISGQLATAWFNPSHPIFQHHFKNILYMKKRKSEIVFKCDYCGSNPLV